MAATDKLCAGSIPEIYKRFLVPLIFESNALDLRQTALDLRQTTSQGRTAGCT